METLKTWFACAVFVVAILGVMDWLDQQGEPKACVGMIKDKYNMPVEFRGKLVEISVD